VRTFWVVLHVVGVVLWVGGMGFSQMVLRPATASMEAPARVRFMMDVLGRFFRLVTVSLVLIWVSGLAMLAPVGMKNAPLSWHIMYGLATITTVIFIVIYGLYLGKAKPALANNDIAGAGAVLMKLRVLISINFVLATLAMVAGLYRG
jgi:uncharacterized membrane protein